MVLRSDPSSGVPSGRHVSVRILFQNWHDSDSNLDGAMSEVVFIGEQIGATEWAPNSSISILVPLVLVLLPSASRQISTEAYMK